jgi:hypothetical protein
MEPPLQGISRRIIANVLRKVKIKAVVQQILRSGFHKKRAGFLPPFRTSGNLLVRI